MGCGGAETVALNLGRYLGKNGFEVEIMTTGGTGMWFHRIAETGMKARHVSGRNTQHHMIHSLRVGRIMKTGRYDVVILSNSERYAHAAINMLPDEGIAIPWVHSDETDAYRKALINEDAWNVAVGVSPKVTQTLRSMCRDRPVVHICNGIETSKEIELKNRRTWGKPFRLIFIGRVEQWSKGVLVLPEIIKRSKERGLKVLLTIIGDGKDLDVLKRKSHKDGIQDKMFFLGALSPSQVYKHLLDSHALLMPSFFEGLPTAPLEAQACGCVPVISRLEGITDLVVDDGQTGFLVNTGDTEGFVDAVKYLHDDSVRWAEMSHAGRRKVLREFTVERMGESFRQLICDCFEGKYPLKRSRRKYLMVNPAAFTWKEHVPRWVHRLGMGNRLRRALTGAR